MKKSNKCFEMDPDAWRAVNGWGLQLLLLPDLACYRRLLPMEEDLQDEWEAVVMHPGKYVNLLVGQRNDKGLRAESDEKNHYDSGPWDWGHKELLLGLPSGQDARALGCVKAR